MKDFQNEEEFFDYLIQNNIMVLYGMTENNEVSYALNLKKLKELVPELYESIMQDMDETLLELYRDNLVQIEYDEDLNVKYGITDEAYEILRKKGYDIFLKEEEQE